MAVITISRQFGAGGKTLGEMISKRLGYYYAVDDIIQIVAREARVSRDWVESIEREAGGTLLKFISGLGRKKYSDSIPHDKPGYIDEEIYVDLLQEIITRIAEEGNAVILGRGSQFQGRVVGHACFVRDVCVDISHYFNPPLAFKSSISLATISSVLPSSISAPSPISGTK